MAEYARLIEVEYNLNGTLAAPRQAIGEGEHSSNERESEERSAFRQSASRTPVWNEALAAALGVSNETVRLAEVEGRLESLAEGQATSEEMLIAAIMQLELQRIRSQQGTGIEAVLELSQVLEAANDYVAGEQAAEDETGQENELENPLLTEASIVVFDAAGRTAFSGTTAEGESQANLFEHAVERGVPILDWVTGRAVGYVLSAREAGDYSAQEVAFLRRTRDGLLSGGLAAAAVALLVGILIAHRISRPILALRDSATQLASGDSADRLPDSTGELGAMSRAFNAMADSLDQQQEIRSKMVADLSHELNTPLAVIRLEVEAWQDGLRTADEAAEHVLSELDLLRNLASDVELLAENDAGLLDLRKEPVDLSTFLPAAAKRWKIQAQSAGVALQIKVAEQPLVVEADPIRLSQAVGNLIRNALQHTETNGTIEVIGSTSYVERLSRTMKLIQIKDSGAGIEPENIHRVFERSVRSPGSHDGRGLGLTIVQKIVDAHDGVVWVESTPGEGSNFCIALP